MLILQCFIKGDVLTIDCLHFSYLGLLVIKTGGSNNNLIVFSPFNFVLNNDAHISYISCWAEKTPWWTNILAMERHPTLLASNEFISKNRLFLSWIVISSQLKCQLVLIRLDCISCPEFALINSDEASFYSHILLIWKHNEPLYNNSQQIRCWLINQEDSTLWHMHQIPILREKIDSPSILITPSHYIVEPGF